MQCALVVAQNFLPLQYDQTTENLYFQGILTAQTNCDELSHMILSYIYPCYVMLPLYRSIAMNSNYPMVL
jgi:hypothetical protein